MLLPAKPATMAKTTELPNLPALLPAKNVLIQAPSLPLSAQPATRIHSSKSARSRHHVSVRPREMIIVLVERDIELMAWTRLMRNSLDRRCLGRSIGFLLRWGWSVLRFVQVRFRSRTAIKKFLSGLLAECPADFPLFVTHS